MQLHVRNEVENYLERSYYDLSTLNLNDCNTYNRMRIIATERYGLHLTDPFLPDGCLDIALDFMDIMKDLNRKSRISKDFQHEDVINLLTFIMIYRIHFSL